MKMYQVSWSATAKFFIQVEAENKDDAQVKAFEQYDDEWDAKPKVDEDSIRVYEF